MPKKNTPVDLADALFMQIERLDDPALQGEKLDAEIQRSDAICRLSTQAHRERPPRARRPQVRG